MGFDYSKRNRRWQALRLLALRRDKYLCRESARYGKVVDANVVHHIWPAEDYPEYAYELWNLVSLCQAQHDAMHDRVTRALTPLGERWRKRTPLPLGRNNRPMETGQRTFCTRREFFGGRGTGQKTR